MKTLNLTGVRFGRAVALEPTDGRERRRVMWRCICDCGTEFTARSDLLKNGSVLSCGCLQRQRAHETGIRNGQTHIHAVNDVLNQNNTSGVKGVIWLKGKQRWYARIKYNYVQYALCYSSDLSECVAARKEAEQAIREGVFEEYIAGLARRKEGRC